MPSLVSSGESPPASALKKTKWWSAQRQVVDVDCRSCCFCSKCGLMTHRPEPLIHFFDHHEDDHHDHDGHGHDPGPDYPDDHDDHNHDLDPDDDDPQVWATGPLLRTNSKKSFKISEKGKVFQMSGEINNSQVPTNVLRIYGSVGLDSWFFNIWFY